MAAPSTMLRMVPLPRRVAAGEDTRRRHPIALTLSLVPRAMTHDRSEPYPPPVAPIVEMIGVTKRFPGVLANDHVDLAIRAGEIHVLLGENGAGKSTLIGMLSGLVESDAGEIRVDGQARRIASPRQALDLGIGTVFQHVMLVPGLTVAENMALGAPWWRSPGRAALGRRLGEIGRGLGLSVRPEAVTGDLSLGEQQQAEILRALMRGSRVLVLDESTSMLTPKGADELGALMRRLAAQGLAVVFITHKLKEAFAYGDRTSVLRLGRKVGEIAPERKVAMNEAAFTTEVLGLMFGGAASPAVVAEEAGAARAPRRARGRELLEVSDLAIDGYAAEPGIDLDVAEGEILGLAGIDGNGQRELAETLAGQRKARHGQIRLGGETIEALDVGGRRRRGLRYVTDNRLGEGTVGSFPVATNLILKEIGEAPYWRHGVEQRSAIAGHARALIEAFDIRTPGPATPIGRLSGGNIQKALLARELSGPARAIVYAKPTYGLDAQNIVATRRRIRAMAERGVATLLISTDLEELIELSDRIAVMAHGRIVGMVENDASARERVGAMMVGAGA